MKMVVLKYDGFPTSINKDSTTNGIPHSCNNGTTVNSGLTLPIQTNCLPSSTGEPKMEQPATNNDSLESNDDNYMFVNDPISEAKENILTTGAISKIAKGQKERNLIVQTGSVVQLVEYICPTAHNGMQMIVVSMEVKIFENEFIGEPKLYVEPAPNLDDGKKEHLTEDKDTSFFMHQSHLLGNHQDLYLANKNNTAIRGDIVPLAQPSI
ncbi:uncharacterized protein LOC113301769 isoform X2 [Papaver somniferum]|uniref:uncharacterized protein LOC113301769 isoform X2 n=1 Tax=Papaver somniferum TaxID=3469 RepID=UPI000E703123|nr:uncharacterized protein LOC113301769 isoform X2 [Papaver somniferum]